MARDGAESRGTQLSTAKFFKATSKTTPARPGLAGVSLPPQEKIGAAPYNQGSRIAATTRIELHL